LLNEYNKLKLNDFGLARTTRDGINPSTDSYPRGKSGSPFYMAPELFTNDGVYSFASDLWSLGCLLFEFLVGKPPFHSKSLKSLMRMISEDPVPIQQLSGCSSMAKDLIKKLLAKDPAKRATYSYVIQHPFWNDKFFKNELEEMSQYIIPEEPAFHDYLRGRGIDPSQVKQF